MNQPFVCPFAKTTKLSDNWIDNQDVTTQLHISLRTLQELRTRGVIPYTKLGNKIYYKRQDIEDVLNSNFQKPHGRK
ncbi:MAG: helix-turn-helix domain-containing protein [Bacteroidales bacterium]|nr:helix-turn-helix domain-containing protein [Bacteroidales bacterium]MCQ2608405.1 helix-turn-helix domain-containing protein [Bacteroidales bacterium]